jgi:hypothetical protein
MVTASKPATSRARNWSTDDDDGTVVVDWEVEE